MDFVLEKTEADLLLTILNRYLSELREEIGKTENYEMRESLKGDEAKLKGMLARLARVQTV